MTDIDLTEFTCEMAHIKSELRLLGFNEETVSRVFKTMDREQVRDMIAKYKIAQAIYNENQS